MQAQYWHDPIQEQFYADHNIFLPGINNEVYVNSTYKENMLSLQNFAMIKFLNDTVVQPRESEVSHRGITNSIESNRFTSF